MGKSSSLKKKRSRNSSQSRMRKRTKVKIRRSKSKKSKKLRHRHDDSVSYSGDSDSRSMASVPSPSSEDDYRNRRSRSRNRKGVKCGKKRARRQSSSRESSEDSPYVKKHRGSRRDDTRKIMGKKKKSMRDVSVSSGSSGSWSCSTCQSGSDEIGHEKRKGRTKRKEKDRRRLQKVKRGSKKSKDRSRSSSCNRYNEGSDHSSEERIMEENNSRRLRSVVTVVRKENESSKELNSDEPKEDVYDYDDYPSCRSIDSNDGSRRELPQHSHVVSETKRPLDDEPGEVSNIRTSSVEESDPDGKCRYDGVGENDALREKNKVSNATGGLNGDDMESILRQRALENLRKFRGELQTNINPPITQNDKSDGDVKTSSSINTDPFEIKAHKGDDPSVVIASQGSQQIRQPPIKKDSTALPKNDRKTSHLNDDGKYSGFVESDVASPPVQVVPVSVPRVEVNTAIKSVSNNSKLVMPRTRLVAPNTSTTQKQEAAAQEHSQAKVTKSSVNDSGLETTQPVKPPKDNGVSVSNRLKSVKSRIRQESPKTYTTQKPESAALESSQAKLVIESSVTEVSLGTAQTVKPPECGNSGDKVNDTHDSACNKPSSSSITTSGGISTEKLEDETNNGSQFQQKRMSVMRGGEMVQVSYQVYIPKRAPALARRQLKR